jgi:hypothetical protein
MVTAMLGNYNLHEIIHDMTRNEEPSKPIEAIEADEDELWRGQPDRFVLVFGLDLEISKMSIGHGLVLKKLDAPFGPFDLLAAGASGFKEAALLDGMANACVCEIQSFDSARKLPGYDTLNRAWLVSALLVLRGFTRHMGVAVSISTWDSVAGHHARSEAKREELKSQGVPHTEWPDFIPRIPSFRAHLLDFHVRLVVNVGWRRDVVSRDDVAWIANNFEMANSLSPDERFHFALAASTDWRFQDDSRAAVARLWSGIEALLGIESELSYRVATSLAALLEPRGSARHERFIAIRKLYDRRSKAVHGIKMSAKETARTVDESFDLLRDLLITTIERGRVITKDDIENAVFY